MGKAADQYLEIHPWKIIENGFHPNRSEVSESLFSLANEYQGVRGFFEEGYSGESLPGIYLNGVYEARFTEGTAYKGISNRLAFMVNTVNWLHTRIKIDDELLDLSTCQFKSFRREVDLHSGEMIREFVWITKTGKQIGLIFKRLLSMQLKELACQQISLTALNFTGCVKVTVGLDFSLPHYSHNQNYWTCLRQTPGALLGLSTTLGQRLFAGMKVLAPGEQSPSQTEKYTGMDLDIDLAEGKTTTIEKSVILFSPRDTCQPLDQVWQRGMCLLQETGQPYSKVLEQNKTFWDDFWVRADITIDGDPETQQGIRFCIFQMQQTYRGILEGSNIGAKGLTGEAYNGNAFWDTETYCLPFYQFNNPPAARALLDFRYKTLPQALDRAKDLDCLGACYPVATSDGSESCTLWQHASLQLQPTTGVAYGIWHYVHVSSDTAFLNDFGAGMLVQICRFLASRGQWSPQGKFGYYAVMGPDEFKMMVNHNAYTNYMAKRTFEYTLQVLARMDPTALGCAETEREAWQQMATAMFIPKDPRTGLFEQHEGFFYLPHLEIASIAVKDFPLYSHWSYDRIFRNDMIKQPDVLMFMFLYNQSFSRQEKQVNYDFYEPRCIHESSLSPSVHSILAAELGRPEAAFEFFRFAARIDLDNYNRNTNEGIHITSIAAAWMNIVYGFGGMRSDGELLSFNPSIPAHWNRYCFQIVYKGSVLSIDVSHEKAFIRVAEGGPVTIRFMGQVKEINQEGTSVVI
jgi:maltose phosphorylase